MTSSCIRWGILGAGKICHDFVAALRVLSKTHHRVVGVANITEESAKAFADEHDIENAYADFKELANADIDIAYVGTINPTHYQLVKMLIDAGKNILCEKPFAVNRKQAEAMIKHAESKGVFLMEAMWSRYFPIYDKIRKILQDGTLGEVKFVNVVVGIDRRHLGRANKKSQRGGAILTMGIYPLQLSQLVFNSADVTNFTAKGTLNEHGVDSSTTAILHYDNNRSATLTISNLLNLPSYATISGQNGTLRIPHFWCPTKLYLDDKLLFECPLPKSDAKFNYFNSVGLAYEAEEVRECLLGKKKESPRHTHAMTLQLAGHLDRWRKELGVVFEEDGKEFK